MKRYLSLLLVVPIGLYAACSSKSDDPNPTVNATADDPNNPDAPDAPGGPVATPDDLKKNPIEGIAPATLILDAGEFTDGPIWSAKDEVLYFTTPLGEGGLFRMKDDGATLKLLDGDRLSGALPIGNTIDKEGVLIRIESKRIVKGTGAGDSGAAVEIASTFPSSEGGVLPFDTLNDAVLSPTGTLYVTDPGYFADPIANRIYRITPAGVVSVVEEFLDVPRPNGIALSPDGKLLYVGFSAPGVGTKPLIRKYHVNPDESLGEHAKFVELDLEAQPDGIEVDQAGNVYIATKAGIEVFRPDASKIGVIAIPEQPTGMAFAGKDLKTMYVTTQGTKIFELHLNVPGIVQ